MILHVCRRTAALSSIRRICSTTTATCSSVGNNRQQFLFTTDRYNRINFRSLSTGSIFNVSSITVTDELKNLPIPDVPPPAAFSTIVDELYATGKSVLNELDLWSPYYPASYIRWLLESLHLNLDVPWWGCIITSTLLLRLALIYVPIMSRRVAGQMKFYADDLKKFDQRVQDAKHEGNGMLVKQIAMERMDFMRKKQLPIFRPMIVMFINGTVFFCQFRAIRGMANVYMPGFSDGGCLWFTDLTSCDPYYALPLIVAVTLHFTIRSGVETAGVEAMNNKNIQLLLLYGLPIVSGTAMILFQFPSAICLYWCTSNAVSLCYALLFRLPSVQRFLKIPLDPVKKPDKVEIVKMTTKRNKSLIAANPGQKLVHTISDTWQNTKKFFDQRRMKNRPVSYFDVIKADENKFNLAGRGKPVTITAAMQKKKKAI